MSNTIEGKVMKAFEDEDFQKGKQLLDENPQLDVNKLKIGAHGLTPLHYACGNGDLEMAKYLILEKGVDVNLKDNDRTALMHAASEGHLNVCQLLIENGADPNLRDDFGQTALIYVAMNGHLNVCQFLCENGADVNLKNNAGMTALMLAAVLGRLTLNVCQFLTENGADVNSKGKDGHTALDYAKARGDQDIVKYLTKVLSTPAVVAPPSKFVTTSSTSGTGKITTASTSASATTTPLVGSLSIPVKASSTSLSSPGQAEKLRFVQSILHKSGLDESDQSMLDTLHPCYSAISIKEHCRKLGLPFLLISEPF
jgi:hypothetical protein